MKTAVKSNKGIDVNKTYVFLINRRSHRGPETDFTIPSVDEIIEPEVGADGKVILNDEGQPARFRTRNIRLLKGEMSIYVDEQNTPFRDQTNKIIQDRPIKAVDRVMTVAGTEINKIEFLLKTNANGSNPYRDKSRAILFSLNEPEKQAAKAIENSMSLSTALYRIFTMEIHELKPLMITLAKSPAEVHKVNAMEIMELRLKAKILAEKDPKKFLSDMKNEEYSIKYIVNSGIGMGTIKVVDQTNSITWNDGGLICQAPQGANAVDHLVLLAQNDKKYEAVIEEIKKRSGTTIPNSNPIKETKPKDTDWLDTAIAQAVEKGILIKNGVWYKIDEQSLKQKELRDYLQADGMAKFQELQSKL